MGAAALGSLGGDCTFSRPFTCAANTSPPCRAADGNNSILPVVCQCFAIQDAMCLLLVSRLNLLGFQWRLTEQDAKWHYAYHQLRRYKAVHGSTDIPADYSDRLEKDWVMVARWVLLGHKTQTPPPFLMICDMHRRRHPTITCCSCMKFEGTPSCALSDVMHAVLNALTLMLWPACKPCMHAYHCATP